MEQISLTGATLLSDYPSFAQIELGNITAGSSTSTAAAAAAAVAHNHGHGHDHDHGHHHDHGDNSNSNNSCPHHSHRAPLMLMTHPQIQALPANIPALVQGGTNAELFEGLCTFIRLSRTLEERNDWYKQLLEELKLQQQQQPISTNQQQQPISTNQQQQQQSRLWQVLSSTSPDDYGHTLFHWAAKRSDDARFLQLLLEYASQASGSASGSISAFVDIINQASVDSVGMTPLHWACTENCQKHVQLLLLYGANLESVDKSGCTPLLIAAQYGHVDLVAILVSQGANGLAVDKSLDTALHWAAYKGSMPVCGVLTFLVPQLSYTTPDAFGQTPLHLAALRGHTSVVRYILANLVQPEQQQQQPPSSSSSSHPHQQQHHDEEEEEDDDEFLSSTVSLLATSPTRRRRRQIALMKIKEDLLWMRDSQGRTPLELAIFKQRPSVAALLQHEMDQLKLHQAYHSSSTPYTRKVTLWCHHNLKLMCSIHNWKVWMGCRPTNSHLDEVDESPKFPFYIVVAMMIMQVIFYPTVFTPIFAVERGILWDLMGWHLLNWLAMICLWYCFFKIATTSPGYVGGVGGVSSKSSSSNISSSSSSGSSGGHRHASARSTTSSSRPHVDSQPLRHRHYSQAALTKKWRRRYEQVLDSFATMTPNLDNHDNDADNNDEKTPQAAAAAAKLKALRERQLCHTCHIARPLRSKHCRVARRCVLMFDHHCPFVGNTVGLYNYLWFYLTLILMTLCEIGFIITWIIYLFRYAQHHPMPWKIFCTGLFISVWILPAGGMAIYHTQLSMVNLTTNEHQNLPRYKYLHDPVTGRYRNPWFQGWFYNLVQRFTPSEASYTLPDEENDADMFDEPMIEQV